MTVECVFGCLAVIAATAFFTWFLTALAWENRFYERDAKLTAERDKLQRIVESQREVINLVPALYESSLTAFERAADIVSATYKLREVEGGDGV